MTESTQPNGDLQIQDYCRVNGKSHTVTIPKSDVKGYHQWRNRDGLIQDCIPNVSKDDREFLISGTSPKGWEELFGDDPED